MLRVRITHTKAVKGYELSDYLVMMRATGIPEEVINRLKLTHKAEYQGIDEEGEQFTTTFEVL